MARARSPSSRARPGGGAPPHLEPRRLTPPARAALRGGHRPGGGGRLHLGDVGPAVAGPLDLFLGRARGLGEHLGPVLYQLPPGWRADVGRLRHFLSALPADLTHVVEFREPTWYADEVRAALTEHGVGFCVHDLRDEPTPDWATGKALYVRFHGPTARAYAGRYSAEQLRAWAGRIAGWRRAGRDVYAYFNNDDAGHAVANARELRSLLDASGPGATVEAEAREPAGARSRRRDGAVS